jgi:hypothetical protein
MNVNIYSIGMCCCSVCTDAKDDELEELTKKVNEISPTGIESKWRISEDKTFKDGINPNPSPCEKISIRRHFLFNC